MTELAWVVIGAFVVGFFALTGEIAAGRKLPPKEWKWPSEWLRYISGLGALALAIWTVTA